MTCSVASVHQAQAYPSHCCGPTGFYLQAFENGLHMIPGRCGCQVQLLGNLPVAQAGRHQLQDFQLPCRQGLDLVG